MSTWSQDLALSYILVSGNLIAVGEIDSAVHYPDMADVWTAGGLLDASVALGGGLTLHGVAIILAASNTSLSSTSCVAVSTWIL